MKNWSRWEPILDNFGDTIRRQIARVETGKRTRGREQEHKFFRDDFALLHRFLAREAGTKDYPVTDSIKQVAKFPIDRSTEWQLRMLLEARPFEETEAAIANLIDMIKREAALVETIFYEELRRPVGTPISVTTFRWLMHLATFRRLNECPQKLWRTFVGQTLAKSSGGSRIFQQNPDGSQTSVTLNLGRLSNLRSVCRLVGVDILPPYSDTAPKLPLKAGYDNSHVLPKSLYGDGETFPEPASDNRARGQRPVTP